jgi:septal ring factor EnvC (AmiA/AmiB activator)
VRYNEYLFAARREKMQVYVDAIKRLSDIEQETIAAIAELETTQVTLEQENSQLISQQVERKQLAAAADTDLQTKGTALKNMERDRAALQKVIDQIEKQRALAEAQEAKRQQEEVARQIKEAERKKQETERQAAAQEMKKQEPTPEPVLTPEPAPEQEQPREKSSPPAYSADDLKKLQSKSFTQRKGSLMWPVQGKVIYSFGEQRQGSVTWDGLRIKSASGSDVHAIHGGRVMYADSLPGQGLLLVLDHGDGYMSLYAHNDMLLHESGEWVQPGDVIARVGNSGGEKEPGLYFEIRKDGEPINPTPWLIKN